MEKRTLGRSGIEVSALGMGCWAIGGPWIFMDMQGGWGQVDDNESIRAIHAALDHGITFFDTAANYGAGHSEMILARALKGRHDRTVIATKFGYRMDESTKIVDSYPDAVENHLRADCEASLRRLDTDIIDLYQFHINAYPAEQASAVREALETLVQEGKIRWYGWSTDAVVSARVFAEGQHCTAIQHDLNLIHDTPEMLTLCEDQNLVSINRSPLARSALTGKYDAATTFAADDIRQYSWSREKYFDRALAQLDSVREILTSSGRTLAQGAIAWIWARSDKTLPIPGIRTVAQAVENARAMDYGPLTPDQMQEIDRLLGRTSPEQEE